MNVAATLVTWDVHARAMEHGIVTPRAFILSSDLKRSFEFLGACSAGNITRSPGKYSFTTALIWALEQLKIEQPRFTVCELSRKIKEAPDFPKDQIPVQIDRCGHAISRIIITPLTKTENSKEAVQTNPNDIGPQGILTLNFVLKEIPSERTIQKFAQALNHATFAQQLPVDRIVWGGLNPWRDIQPSAGVQSSVIRAAQILKHRVARRKSIGKNDEIVSGPSSDYQTSSVTSTLDSLSRPRKKIKKSAA